MECNLIFTQPLLPDPGRALCLRRVHSSLLTSTAGIRRRPAGAATAIRCESHPRPAREQARPCGCRFSIGATLLPLFVLLGLLSPLRAVIFYSTADMNYNTTAPTGELAGSGWQWVGTWGGFQGAPIGPHHFLAARHVGGAVGDLFVLGGVSYTTVAWVDDTLSDLRIWEVSGTFPTWAPLYRASNEPGKALVVFGRGLTRGAEVREAATNTLRGWQWGAGDGRLRWGRNVVYSVVNGGSYWGSLLYARFDQAGGADEAHLAAGDSSGPVFIHDGTGWKLAGLAAAVDAYFKTTETGGEFIAAIFDKRGLWYNGDSTWILITGPSPSPSGFYATQVSARTAWIDGIVPPDAPPAPTPATPVPALAGAWSLLTAACLLGAGLRHRAR